MIGPGGGVVPIPLGSPDADTAAAANPQFAGMPDPFGGDPTAMAIWQERERRQRSVRTLMMFMLMMLLMDGEEGQQHGHGGLRTGGAGKANQPRFGKIKNRGPFDDEPLEAAVYKSRRRQEESVRFLAERSDRYQQLIQKNGGRNVEKEVLDWAIQQSEHEKDQLAPKVAADAASAGAGGPTIAEEEKDAEEDDSIFHYPWNSTGFYRGDWTLNWTKTTTEEKQSSLAGNNSENNGANNRSAADVLSAEALEKIMVKHVLDHHRPGNEQHMGVYVLPEGLQVRMRDDHNLTTIKWDEMKTDSDKHTTYDPESVVRQQKQQLQRSSLLAPSFSKTSDKNFPSSPLPPKIMPTRDSGRAAFQLYSRTIPAVTELSLVDGFIKLYDAASRGGGYWRSNNLLLRVRGVLIHATGRLSLVSSAKVARSVLVINNNNNNNKQPNEGIPAGSHARRMTMTTPSSNRNQQEQHRYLKEETLADLKNAIETKSVDRVRDRALELFSDHYDEGLPQNGPGGNRSEWSPLIASSDANENPKLLTSSNSGTNATTTAAGAANEIAETKTVMSRRANEFVLGEPDQGLPEKKYDEGWSDIVLPFPFVRDDSDESIRKHKTQAARAMPPREQQSEANAGACEFEISMDLEPVEWTLKKWRSLVSRRIAQIKRLAPTSVSFSTTNSSFSSHSSKSSIDISRKASLSHQDEALVMNMAGEIHSLNCGFTAKLNVTAVRTDWEAMTSKAISYSFYMMVVCLTQILILLRQLLHSQTQSAAVRVSLLCIGWQATVDAILCMSHIYLSLTLHQLFTAFASVAFFKLLIFCVIEMKYMAILLQARNSNNAQQQQNPTEVLRRQVAMLHLRFYVALSGTFLLLLHAGESFRIYYVLALYSFWVPQIVLNVITEARTPMHKYYVYGMSATRMVAPIYMMAVPNNFIKQFWPEFATDSATCQALLLWMTIQTAVLIGQGKYGARFMIPARFLPPKFDYSRPLPPSMLSPGEDVAGSTNEAMEDRLPQQNNKKNDDDLPVAAPTRQQNRRRRKKVIGEATETALVEESPSMTSTQQHPNGDDYTNQHRLECCICYDPINIMEREEYMLAPCDHLFHKGCLVQWMEVKMECPICRTDLPAI